MSLFEEPMRSGEVLKESCLNPLGMGTITLVRHLDVPSKRVEQLVEGVNSITPDMAFASGTRIKHDPGLLDEHANKLRHGRGVQKG